MHRWPAKSTLNRLELGKPQPTPYHKTGHDPQADSMRRALAVVRELGGAARCNSFTKFYLALLGQFQYAAPAGIDRAVGAGGVQEQHGGQ